MLQTGIKGKQTIVVTPERTAAHYGSGALEVFATPAMVALLEETAWKSVQPYLEEGQGTVGTRVDVRHLAPTPLGGKVTCESELVEIDRRRLVFRVEVFDERTKVGEGIHERFVIQSDKFLVAANAKGDA
ncbi:MAG: thioesterase family protein [Clostridia bacterium]|nr:thioesterase family protein [Clostridia bacterium]